jgi:hypothetical protein
LVAGNSIGGANGGALTLTAGSGGTNLTVGTATGGSAGGITFNGGNGATAPNATVSSTGGSAGGFTINGGTGGTAAVAGTGNNTGGNGGSFTWTAGNGGAASGATTGINTGGLGGTVTLRAGNGGAATTGTGTLQGGAGGGLVLQAGTGGTGTVSGIGGAVTLRGGTSNTAGGDVIVETASTTTLTERMRVTNTGYVGIGTGTTTSLPNARLTVVAENVTGSQIKLRSQRVAVVATNVVGGIDFDSNDSSLTAPGVTTARIQAVATASHTTTVNDTALVFSTSSGATLTERWRINASGEFQGNGASILRANAGNLTISTVTSGNVIIDGAGTLEVQDNININSSQLTVGSSTVNSTLALNNFAVNSAIGTAAATVDVRTGFTINQTTAGRTLTLPTPTANTVAGRIVYISNIGTTSFTMHGVTINSGASQSYIYNGSTWAPTNVGGAGAGVNAVGLLDSQTKSSDGAVISGTSIYLQTADVSNPGLVSTGTQSFAGDKTFTGTTSFTGAGTALLVSNDAGITGNLSVGGLTTVSGSLIASGSSTVTTGTTTGTGTNTTTLTLTGDTFNVNDVIYIDNIGQDYYTRITVDPGTGSYTISPAVTFDNNRTVTKYTVQNIGATTTDYSNLNNRFFQGYFLGGVVIGAGSTTISDGAINSTTTLRLQENGGDLTMGGALNVSGTITGDASGLTNINGANISNGSIADASLSTNVTLLGNTFNGANQLVQLNASSELPGLSGVNLTNLNADNIASGTLSDSRLSSNVTLLGNTFNGINQLVRLDGAGKIGDSLLSSNITAAGNTFNGNSQLVQLTGTGALPALNGSGLTSLNGSNISSGTVADARLSTNVTLLGNTFNGANQLVQLNASSELPGLSGVNLTNLNADNIASGTLSDSRLSSNVTLLGNTFNGINQLVRLDGAGKIGDSLLSSNITAAGNTFNGNSQLVQLTGTGALPALNGSGLTSLNGSNISSGTVADARLSTNVTLLGNTFNGANQLVQLNASSELPGLSGVNLTNLNADNIASGTLSDSRLSSNVTLLGNTFNGINQLVRLDGAGKIGDSLLSSNITAAGNTFNGNSQLVQLTGTGALPALNGSGLTSLNGSNISSGTVADARLSTNVTLLGNTFNGANQLVQLDASGYLPALNGSALTTLNASNISSGTIADARLSTNVTTQGNTFNGNNQLLQLNASGLVNDSLLSTTITKAGNTFNGANGLVQLDSSGNLPALNGSALTNLNATNIASGTLSDSRLSSNVTLLGNTFNGINQLVRLDGAGKIGDSLLSSNITAAGNTFNGNSQLVQLTGTGALPALNGSGLTSLNGSNISSGTVADTRLSTNVTLLGNTFNGANQLVQLEASGVLPTLSGTNLTGLSAGNISSGTLDDSRLSSNVGLTNASQTYSAQQTFAANILLGTDSSTPTAGTLTLNDSVASNGFTSVLGTSSLTANRSVNLPNESGTLCISSSINCGFILLAPGSAQADSTTNNMLYLNKTGASGDILNLQKNGTSILRMLNSGALQLALTDAAAFTVENASGTDYFNVDTSGGLVRIGGAAADATGVLLVLDTKNTAGDPTGTNGGMYYNSVDNKNRCYENGTWVDCSTMTLAGETTLGAASGTINVTLNGNYEYLECRVDIVSRSAASIPYLRFNNNTGGTSYGWNSYGIVAAATTDWQDASDSEIQLTGTQTGTNIISADMKITNINGANKVVDWTSAGVEAVGTNSNRYSGVGGFYNSAQVTSMQIVASTGTFAAGSHAWCQGKNVR